MKQSEIQDDLKAKNYVNKWKASHKFIETGQVRRAKMHAARLIDAIDDKKVISPALHQLLEASLFLETTDSKILAAYLKRSPVGIRAEFQRIHIILEEYQRHSKSVSIGLIRLSEN